MALIVGEPDVKYTPKDFQSIRPEIIALIKNRYPGIVTDFSSQNVVTVVVELMAYLSDMLAYYQDAQARETFFPTAKLRASLLKHVALIGFKPEGRVAATALVRITLLSPSAFPTLVPSGSSFRTADQNPVEFRTLSDATIPAGGTGTFIDVYVENSDSFQETYEAKGGAFETFTSNANPVLLSGIDDTGNADPNILQIYVAGIPYTIVPTFLSSSPTDKHVTVSLDERNRLITNFGDGITGVAASGQVDVFGRFGGGTNGNNSTVTQGPSLTNTNNEPVSVSFNNSVVSAGGANEQTIESIKVQAPLSLQANNRTVSRQDFISNSENVSGITRSLPITSNEDIGVEENKTELIVLTESPTNAQLIGGNAASPVVGPTIVAGVNDDVGIEIDGEVVQFFSIGSHITGETAAAALETLIRAATPEFPLDHAESFTNFSVTFDTIGQRYILTTGQAGLDARIGIVAGPNDATVDMKLTPATGALFMDGAEPSAAAIAAVVQELTVEKPICITHVLEVLGPSIAIVNLDLRLRFENNITTAAAKTVVRNAVRAAYENFFRPRLASGVSNPEIDFGRIIRITDLICVANDTVGVESLDEDNFFINGVGDDFLVPLRAFPVLGGLTVRDAAGVVI